MKDWLSCPENVYSGRRGRIFINGIIFHYKESKWANPYKVTKDMPLKKSLRKYLDHLIKTRLIKDIYELEGKNIGCFCPVQTDNNDNPMCHAQLLVDLLTKCKDKTDQLISLLEDKSVTKSL